MAENTSGSRTTKKRAQNAEHERLITDIKISFGATGKMRMFSMVVGYFQVRGQTKKIGIPGFPDLFGFLSNGRIFFCEVKTGKGKLTPKQKKFREVAEKFNCHYLECRSLMDFEIFYHKITTDCPQVYHSKEPIKH